MGFLSLLGKDLTRPIARLLSLNQPGTKTLPETGFYSELRFEALASFHRRFSESESRRRPSALMPPRRSLAPPLPCFAQRSFCAAEILARAAALMVLRPAWPLAEVPRISASRPSSFSIRWRMTMARFNCFTDTFDRRVLLIRVRTDCRRNEARSSNQLQLR